MTFLLASRLGMTVRDLRRRMPRAELTEWRAFLEWERDEQAKEMERAKQQGKSGKKGPRRR